MTVEQLRTAREESSNVAYLTFNQYIRIGKDGLFCFFEGKDSPFYFSKIRLVYDGEIFPIICKGKDKVIKVYNLIAFHDEYNKYKKCFFVDSDFDPKLGNEDIYETDGYSIENFYTTLNVFCEILKNEFHMSETHEDYEKCVSLFNKLQTEFHDAVELFNAWYCAQIHIKHNSKIRPDIILDDHTLKKLVSITLQSVISKYTIDDLTHMFPNSFSVSKEILEEKRNYLRRNRQKYFRGKFEFEFLLKLLNNLITDSCTNNTYCGSKIKYSINYSQSISQFSQYSETSSSLLEYIQNKFRV